VSQIDSQQGIRLLNELESLSSEGKTAAQQRRTIWESLTNVFGKASERELAAYIATELQVQPLTVRRWLSGEFGPRYSHIADLKSKLTNQPESSSFFHLDRPVSFDGLHVAIRSIPHVFYAIRRAKACFVFKGALGLNTGRPSHLRRTFVNEVLTANDCETVLYYAFLNGSLAHETFQRFWNSSELAAARALGNITVDDRIRRLVIPAESDNLGLGYSPASPIVLHYGPTGITDFQRSIDVFYEVPVDVVGKDNLPDEDAPLKTVFIQLPEQYAVPVWLGLRKFLKKTGLDRKVSPEHFNFGVIDEPDSDERNAA
jgi:hypothetical protein